MSRSPSARRRLRGQYRGAERDVLRFPSTRTGLAASVTPYPITYHDAGDGNFLAASDASTALTVNQAARAISFTDAPATGVFRATFHVNPVSSSGLPVSLAGVNCTVAPAVGGGFNVTMTSRTNPAVLTASQPGDGNHSAAANVTVTVASQKAPATVVLDPASLHATSDGSAHFASASTTPAGLSISITYAQGGNPVASPRLPVPTT